MQLTLVAHYRPKPSRLAEYIDVALTAIKQSPVGRHFRPYAPDQMHGTIVALDRVPGAGSFDNANRLAAAGVRQSMDFACALEETVRDAFSLCPIDVPTAASDLSFVRYTSSTLSPATSRAHPAADPTLTPMRLRQWYNVRP